MSKISAKHLFWRDAHSQARLSPSRIGALALLPTFKLLNRIHFWCCCIYVKFYVIKTCILIFVSFSGTTLPSVFREMPSQLTLFKLRQVHNVRLAFMQTLLKLNVWRQRQIGRIITSSKILFLKGCLLCKKYCLTFYIFVYVYNFNTKHALVSATTKCSRNY